MLLEFLVQRLICNVAVATEFSWLLNDFVLKTWFPWLTEGEESDWVFVDGPEKLGYQLIARNLDQTEEEQFLDLDEYRYLLRMRNAEEGEGDEVGTNNWVVSWVN